MGGYENVFNCRDIAKFLNQSSTSSVYGRGWRCTRVSARYVDYSGGTVEVTAYVQVTGDNAENYSISDGIEGFISQRLEDFDRRYPGVLEETDPSIDIVIRKR